MKKLIVLAITLLIILGAAAPAGAIWLDRNHWVDENLALKFHGTTVYVWRVMPEFGGRMYLGTWTLKEANEYLDHWYYIHSL